MRPFFKKDVWWNYAEAFTYYFTENVQYASIFTLNNNFSKQLNKPHNSLSYLIDDHMNNLYNLNRSSFS